MAAPLVSLLYGPIYAAKYRTVCRGCGLRIKIGQEIVKLTGGWMHATDACIRKAMSLTPMS
jgi:hypothetical protein